jgi:microsomal epoxide hydrolase
MAQSQPFSIDIPEAQLADLQDRLARTRWPGFVDSDTWERGMCQRYLRELVSYWQDSYDWRSQEAALNRFDHYRTELDGLGLHFIHERGKGPNPIPLILTHGWPDSFHRMHKLIPLLTDPGPTDAEDAVTFDVIVPSLPGYGFSDLPAEPGMSPRKIAGFWHRLMTEVLGYKRYGAHGGDMGSSVSMALAVDHEDALLALHLTDVPYGVTSRADVAPEDLTEKEHEYQKRGQEWGMQEAAYGMVHSTKPNSLGPAMDDSPAGLAAWIVPHWRGWSDCDGNIESVFSKDDLLTNLMIYWVTGTATSSFQLYYETAHDADPIDISRPVRVPTGFAMFPKDLVPAPREWAERFFTVSHWSEMPQGGHFAALEQPELLAEDLLQFFAGYRD